LLERRVDLRAKVRSAMFYPKLVLLVMFASTLLFVYVIIPKVKIFLEKFGAELPPITQAVIQISDFALRYWPLIAAAGILGVLAFKTAIKKPKLKLHYDRLLLKIPTIGSLLLQLELNSICFITELLLKSGIPLLETLSILKTTLSNSLIAQDVGLAEKEIKQGGSLARGLKKSPLFPEMFTNLIAMGEESGRLESVLGKIGEHYRREIDYRLGNLAKLIEPLLLFIIFIGVGILAFAVYLPLWKMTQVIRG